MSKKKAATSLFAFSFILLSTVFLILLLTFFPRTLFSYCNISQDDIHEIKINQINDKKEYNTISYLVPENRYTSCMNSLKDVYVIPKIEFTEYKVTTIASITIKTDRAIYIFKEHGVMANGKYHSYSIINVDFNAFLKQLSS